jgi:hypothetical protein
MNPEVRGPPASGAGSARRPEGALGRIAIRALAPQGASWRSFGG